MSGRLLGSLATTDALAAAFSDTAMLQGMLRFEAALARAEARAGLVPAAVADAIAALQPDAFDAPAIADAARKSGTIAIAFVDALRARIGAVDTATASYVHWGATSQDVTDTALVLCLQQARTTIDAHHARLTTALTYLSEQHRDTVLLARTLLQPAAPTTFGLKAAGWLGAIDRGYTALDAAGRNAAVLQFGGASGTLAALGTKGPEVAELLAGELGLTCPDAPWHAHRDRLAALIAACGVYTGSLGKLARDVSLLMQFEVAEAAEPGGGSSSMPHKRNPAGCAVVLAASTRLPGLVAAFLAGMPQEHERGIGGWHAEAATIADAVQTTGSAAAAAAELTTALTVDPDRMQRNLSGTRGVVFAERAMTMLAPAVGFDAAKRAVAAAVAQAAQGQASFAEALAATDAAAALTAEQKADLTDPRAYLGAAETFRRRLLDRKG
jgi:3-carboxy-cis,cis-muconate cycloisomerase